MEIDVKKLISTENVRVKVTEQLESDLVNKIKWNLEDTLQEEIQKFIKEEVAPVVIRELVDNKEKIIKQLKGDIIKIAAVVGETLLAKAIENLDSSWKVKEIAEKLFT